MARNRLERVVVKHPNAIEWADVPEREAALIRRCVAGEEDACTELVAEHHRTVFNLAYRLLDDQDEALELTQEVFLRVFRTLPRFRSRSTLRTWIYRITVNQARNRQRWWRRRRPSTVVSLDAHLARYGDLRRTNDVNAPDRVYRRREMARRLRDALTRLPFEQRTAVVLRELDGLSYAEIAYSLGLPVGTVKSRLTRARQALRAQLKAP